MVVDQRILPPFMLLLEAKVYGHGYAYRQGGDEYVVLLPSLSPELAIAFLEDIRRRVDELRFSGMVDDHARMTVSIGVCLADADCYLTNRELLERANRASLWAKEHGRNRIAGYTDPTDDTTLHTMSVPAAKQATPQTTPSPPSQASS